VAMGYVRAPTPFTREEMLAWRFSIDIAGETAPARVLARAAFPPPKVS